MLINEVGIIPVFRQENYEKANGLPTGGLVRRKSVSLASEINLCSAAGHSREDIISSFLILRRGTYSAA